MRSSIKLPLLRTFGALFTLALGLTAPATVQAQALPPYWEAQREEARAVYRIACKGDETAMREVQRQIENNHPVYLNAMAWLRKNCEPYKHLSEHQVAQYQANAARIGYPSAVQNYGNRLIRDIDDGIPQAPERGVATLERAIDLGAIGAAGALVKYYSEGVFLPRDIAKARKYLAIAEAKGMSAKQLEARRAEIAKAIEEERAKGNAIPEEGAEEPRFAALAVSEEDGGFGFAHDYGSDKEAAQRAKAECESRGGRECDVKLVGRGKGCMAYHHENRGSSAYGWGMGPDRSAVEARAAAECRKRNGNANCGNTAWVCNDRTEAAFSEVLRKDLPPLRGTATGGVACNYTVSTRCNIPGNKLPTTFAYESYKTGEKMMFPGFSSCDEVRATGLVVYREYNGEPSKLMTPDLEPQRAFILGLVEKLKARVQAKYPGCKSKYGPPYYDVSVGYDNKSKISNNPSSFTRKDGTPQYVWFKW